MPGLLNPLVPLRGQQAPGRSVVNRPIRRMGLSPMSATTFTGCFGAIKTVGHAPGLYGVRRRASLAAALHMVMADTFNRNRLGETS